MGGLSKDCQMCSTCLCGLQTRLAPHTWTAIRCIGFISAVDVGSDLVPTGVKREPFSLRARVALRLVVVGNICHRQLRSRWECVPFLGGTTGIALANMRIREIGLQLFVGTRREVLFAMVMTVGTAYVSRPRMLRQAEGYHVGFGPIHHGGSRPIILPVANGLRLHDDLIWRIDPRLAMSALNDAMGGLHCGRFVIGDMTLECFASLASLRGVRCHKGLAAGRLPL
jgi:hypothetical protein